MRRWTPSVTSPRGSRSCPPRPPAVSASSRVLTRLPRWPLGSTPTPLRRAGTRTPTATATVTPTVTTTPTPRTTRTPRGPTTPTRATTRPRATRTRVPPTSSSTRPRRARTPATTPQETRAWPHRVVTAGPRAFPARLPSGASRTFSAPRARGRTTPQAPASTGATWGRSWSVVCATTTTPSTPTPTGAVVTSASRSASPPSSAPWTGRSASRPTTPSTSRTADRGPGASNDLEHVESVLRRAADERRLQGGSLLESASLTASGGWCAPSETLYDLLEVESRDGLLSLPEVGARRGGISRTLGPDFRDIFATDIGWNYTEQEDIDGDYDGAGGGSKPCYRIDCPDFEEFRLQVAGVCIQSGLLQQRPYPEVLSRTTRGVLVAHDHKMSARKINAIVEGSDAVTIPAPQAGALAPLLTSLELQVEHMRYVRRLSRNATMEAILPYWVRGVVRADLARRNGVDLPNVSDSQIDGWFRSRGINPQYVYDWQDLTGDAGDRKRVV